MQILTVLRHLSKSSHKRESESERKHKQINTKCWWWRSHSCNEYSLHLS